VIPLTDVSGEQCDRNHEGASAPFAARTSHNFSWRQYSSHDRRVELVFPLTDVSRVVAHAQNENGKSSLFFESFMGDGHGQNASQPVLPISRLIAMLAQIPGEDSHLIEIEREAVMRLG
jgi:hypothetical protein